MKTDRQWIVQFAHWACAHEPQIHYAEIRPIPHVTPHVLPHLPFTTDCSGFSTMEISATAIVDGVQILGPGFDGEAGFGAVHPALLLDVGANGTKLYNMLVYGGAPTIQWNCPECQAYNVNGAFAYVNGSAVAAEWYFQAGGGELYNVSADDNEYPYGTPTPPFTYTAWATNQSVATNAVRTATCQDGNSYVIQAKIGGTTSGSAKPAEVFRSSRQRP